MKVEAYNGIGNTMHVVLYVSEVKSVYVWLAIDNGKVLGSHVYYDMTFPDGKYTVYERKATFCEVEKCLEVYKNRN